MLGNAVLVRPGSSIATAARRWPIMPIALLLVLFTAAIFAPILAPHDPTKQSLLDRNAPPAWFKDGSSKRLLGGDFLGRDILSRIIYGARVSLIIAAFALGTGITIGTTLGLLAGYVGGHVDELIMRFVDVTMAIPFLLLALITVIVLGQSFAVIIGVLVFGTWSGFARQVRAETLQLKQLDYVAMARIANASPLRILYRHILPGVFNTLIVIATLRVGSLILAESILSYLGAGIPPPTPAWGAMVADGRDYLRSAWWVAVFPGIAIFLTVLALNFIGDWLRDRFDPRLRQI